MNIATWILQVLLAVVFLQHGLLFLNPPPDIAVLMDEALPRWFQLFMGVAEVLAAIGLIVPGLARIRPGLVAWAADGVAFVMVSATIWHVVRAEYSSAASTLVLLVLACFVAWVRHVRLPIRPRGAAAVVAQR